MNDAQAPPPNAPLAGERLLLVGPLASMSAREATRLIEAHGGSVSTSEAEATLVVVGDGADPPDSPGPSISETELWERLGLLDERQGLQRLYTPAMLAQLVGAPLPAIRRWRRRNYLRATREVGRLAYFDFQEARVAGLLAELLEGGCSLARIDRLVDELSRVPGGALRPLADLPLVVEGDGLYVRRGADLSEVSGQRLLDFDRAEEASSEPLAPAALSMVGHAPDGDESEESFYSPDEARATALELEDCGDLEGATELLRGVLMSGAGTADDHFQLADLLYRRGEPAAARERYYVALELDESFAEARVTLGCVLSELGDDELAIAALTGALDRHEQFPDAHYHLADLFDRIGRRDEAELHWRRFLELAPGGPWAEEAHQRLTATD